MTHTLESGAPTEQQRTRQPRHLTLSEVWAFLSVALPVVALLLPRLSMIDLAYQVRSGILMLDRHGLLRTDPFTFTVGGKPWLNQQWGAELLFGLAYRLGGWPLLIVLRAALGGLISWLVFLSCRERGAGKKLAAGLTIGGFAVSLLGLSLRPQMFGLILFAVTVWLVAGRDRHPRRLWLVVPIVAVWANVHGSFFLGPLLLGLAFVEDRHRRSPHAWRTAAVSLAATGAATLSPFGLSVWHYAFGLSTNKVITNTIVEWRPTSVRTLPGFVFFLSVVAVVVILARRRRSTEWPSLLTLGVFFLVGLFALRGIYWWALIAPSVLAPIAMDRFPNDPVDEPRILPNTAIASMLVVLAVAFLPWWRSSGPAGAAALLRDDPTRITTQLRALVRPGGRMFVPQIWGSWFEFALPGRPVFVDSRIEVFPTSVWRDYDAVSGAREGWQRILDRWGVDVVVADRGQQAGLLPEIKSDPGWRLAYEDADGLIFTRR